MVEAKSDREPVAPSPDASSSDTPSQKKKQSFVGALFGWARSASLSAIPFIGTVDGMDGAVWTDWAKPSSFGPAPGAATAGEADLLLVVGRISQKLAPVLMRTHASMAHPALVLYLPMRGPAHLRGAGYASIEDLNEVLPIDVVIEGCPPHADDLAAGLKIIAAKARRGQR